MLWTGLVGAAFADERLVAPPGDIAPLAVMAIAEDADGWLWFGGIEGLYRYDGARRTRWGGDFAGEPIEILQVGERATVLGQDRHLYVLTRDSWEELPGPVPEARVRHAAWSDAALWAVAEGGLYRRVGEAWSAVASPVRPRLVRAAPEGVWVLGADALVRLDDVGVVLEQHPIPDAMDVAADGSGGWVVTREHGIWRWDASGVRRIAEHEAEWGESVALAAGGAWVATTRRVRRFAGDVAAHEIAVPVGIPQHDVLHVDREGSLWVGTHRGPRVRVAPDAWQLETPGREEPWMSWLGARGDTTWAASWGTAGRFVGEEWRPAEGYHSFSWPFCATPDGDVTLGWRADYGALVRLADDAPVELARAPAGDDFGGCAPAADGGLWVGLSSGLYHLGPGGLTRVDAPVDGVAALLVDGAGRLHVAGGDRECHADGADVVAAKATWACAPGWTGWVPRQLVEVSEGRVWAVGVSTGILEESPDGWVRHPGTTTLPSPTVRALVPSRDGGVWLASAGPLLRVEPGSAGAPWTVLERLGAAAGVPPGGASHVVERDDGGLWLATDDGVVTIAPDTRRALPPPPAPVFVEVWLNGLPVAPDAPLVATWPHNQLELRAATPTWRDRGRLRWRARVGDAALTESPDATLRIVDLSAGDYAITVEATVDGGATWSAPSAPLRVSVPLPWYLRPPTLVAGTLLVAGAAAVAWRLRLEAALRVERERTRIAMDLHDDLGAGLSTITMLTGLAASDDLSDEARREVAGEAATAAATLTDALAGIVWTLRRDAGSAGTLSRSLVERGRRLFASGETRFVVDVAEEWPQRPLPLPLYRNLQLIGYEALGNAAKHAGAREVTLRFHPWTLEIADDGRGLSAVSPQAGTGTGLPSMRARAAAVGAKLDVADRPGDGTIVRVTFRP